MPEHTATAHAGTALVTGASSGIGKAYADRLGGRGYDLILVARRSEKLRALADDLHARHGVTARPMVADLSDATQLEDVATVVSGDPSITLLVNNAGVSKAAAVADSDWADFEWMTRLNVMALSRLTLAVLPGFKARDRGTIINVGSVSGFASYAGMSFYSGTKAFIQNFTEGLQGEVAGTGVVVQLVAPAGVATEIWEVAGVPLSTLDPATVMSAEDCVDAALRGLDLGELITTPSVEDPNLLADYRASAKALFETSQTGRPASRYAVRRSGEAVS